MRNLRAAIPVLDGSDRSWSAGLLRAALGAAEPVYRWAVQQRNRTFDRSRRQPLRLARPVLSVGNLTTGGTGKTPFVIDLARRLENPGVLLRGYHGGDETIELRSALAHTPGAEVQADPDRAAGAAALLARAPRTNVLLLDDGFQHRQIHRDLDLVLIDAMQPFGFDRLLPRGLLREPVENLRRADAVILTRCDRVSEDRLCDLDDRVADLTGSPPLAHTAHRWSALRDDTAEIPLDPLRGLRVVGVCGIGNPEAFERTLQSHAGRVQAMAVFADHHAYTHAQLEDIFARARRDFADAVVTTEKDYVKWKPLLAKSPPPLAVLRPVLTIAYLDGETALMARVRKAIAQPALA